MKCILFISTLLTGILSALPAIAAEQTVGKFVQLRGTTNIDRNKKLVPAKVKTDILDSDIITTGSSSKAKMLFIDDSVITLDENSKMIVKEFIYSKGKVGKSIFNLLDGKMRSVVGKTRFEVHTPTAVAAARGTIIFSEVGIVNNQNYTLIISLEGDVQVWNIVSTVSGQVTLTPGTMVVVNANQPPPPPVPVPPALLNQLGSGGSGGGGSILGAGGSGGGFGGSGSGFGGSGSGFGGSGGGFGGSGGGIGGIGGGIGGIGGGITGIGGGVTGIGADPPIQQQPIIQPSGVNIIIGIPGQ